MALALVWLPFHLALFLALALTLALDLALAVALALVTYNHTKSFPRAFQKQGTVIRVEV